MTFSAPRLRRDLTVSEQSLAGEIIAVVKDPISGSFFRLGEAEYFIAAQLDGETSLEVVRRRVEERFETELPAESLQRFVRMLEKGGLLETGNASASAAGRAARRRARRFQGGILCQRFRVCDPDRLFSRLVGRVRFFFTPHFVVLSALMILFSAGLVAMNWEDVRGSVSRLFQVSALPVALITIFVVITAHEFAHGLTCKYFGGEVHELGLLLIYLQPAFYCNVSDAWLFPRKASRLWVGFAGPYFELFLWSLAAVVWRLTDMESSVNYIAFVVMTSTGIKTLFNFNPLIKMDGYYLLSDYLEIPNLRQKSFSYVGHLIKRLFCGGPPTDSLSRRQRRFCLAYGLVGLIGSVSLLGLAIVKLGSYLVEKEQPMAFVFFAGLLGTKFRSRFRRLFGKSSGAPDPDDDFGSGSGPVDPDAGSDSESGSTARAGSGPGTPAAVPGQTNGHGHGNGNGHAAGPSARAAAAASASAAAPAPAPAPAPAKKRDKRPARPGLRRAILWILLAAATALYLVYGQGELKIRGRFNVLPVRNADVRSEVEGILEELYVEEGQTVHAGDVIARLSDRDWRSELRKTEADIAQSRARLRMLEIGPTAEEIEVARTAVTKARDHLNYSRQRLQRDKSLFEQSLLSRKDFEETQEQAATDENELAVADSKLKLLLKGTRPEEIEAIRAEIARQETQRRFLEEQLRLLTVTSPIDGVIATPELQLMEMRGQLVKKGELIAKVYEIRTITAEIVVSERDIADVTVGQVVRLKARAHPRETFLGKVTAIATVAQINASSSSGAVFAAGAQTASGSTAFSRANVNPKTILVTTRIDNQALLLKPEMTGQAKIFCGSKRPLDLLIRRLTRTLNVEFWSWL